MLQSVAATTAYHTFTPTGYEAIVAPAVCGVYGVHALCDPLVATHQTPVLQVPHMDTLGRREEGEKVHTVPCSMLILWYN